MMHAAGGKSSGGGHSSRSGSRSHKGSDQKTTRIRTVLNEKQLHTLRTCYGANPRPDALMKEQLVEMTGLSPRVIRVWFQNKRCKDKKRSILMKQLQLQQQQQHQHQDKVTASYMAHSVSTAVCNWPHRDGNSRAIRDHPAEVTFPPLPQPKLVFDLATSEGCEAESTYITYTGWAKK